MANAKIHQIGPGEYDLLANLYNETFRPPEEASFFKRRLDGRRAVLCLVAELEGKPVGFSVGYELRPTTYYSWLCGVIPDARRMGVASQLMEAEQAWAKDHGYEMMRFECSNRTKAMLLVALHDGYDIVGIRWDSHIAGNLVIFEKYLEESA